MDLTDEQWGVVEPLIPDPLPGKIAEADPGEHLVPDNQALQEVRE